jgi:hypothetical protein
MHIPAGFGVRAPARRELTSGPKQYEEQFFDLRRLIGPKNALLIILIALFYIDYQVCISSKLDLLGKYSDFAKVQGRRILNQAVDLSAEHRLDQPAFYQGDVGFVSLN